MSKFDICEIPAHSKEEQEFMDNYVTKELTKLGKTAKELDDEHFVLIIDDAFDASYKKFHTVT